MSQTDVKQVFYAYITDTALLESFNGATEYGFRPLAAVLERNLVEICGNQSAALEQVKSVARQLEASVHDKAVAKDGCLRRRIGRDELRAEFDGRAAGVGGRGVERDGAAADELHATILPVRLDGTLAGDVVAVGVNRAAARADLDGQVSGVLDKSAAGGIVRLQHAAVEQKRSTAGVILADERRCEHAAGFEFKDGVMIIVLTKVDIFGGVDSQRCVLQRHLATQNVQVAAER